MNRFFTKAYLLRLVLRYDLLSVFLFRFDESFLRFIVATLRLLFDRKLNARLLYSLIRPPTAFVILRVPLGRGVLLLNKLKNRFVSVGSTFDTKGFDTKGFCSFNIDATRFLLVFFGITFPVT